jgi:two-component system chemotaxis response regulator CheY
MGNKKLMIVDDSPAIHMIIERAVKGKGFEICANAKNGVEGIIKFKAANPDVITMDVTMPIKDGLEASREILSENPNVKIIMLSAMGDDELINEAQKVGIKTFLKKPFKADELLNALNSLLSE